MYFRDKIDQKSENDLTLEEYFILRLFVIHFLLTRKTYINDVYKLSIYRVEVDNGKC